MDQTIFDTQAPLSQFTVIDASTHLAGPLAGLMLADLGATVLKVEPPSGDPLRNYTGPGESIGQLAASINRNKKSLPLDLRSPEGRASFLELIATADVLLHNWRTATEQSLDLGDDLIATENHQLVRVAITGFGPSGPRADQPAFDQIVQAMSGLATRQGTPGGPDLVRTYIADKTSSMFAVQAVLAGLLRRTATNTGIRIDVPMLDAMAYSNFPDLYEGRIYLDQIADFDPPRRLRSIGRTADGHIVIAPGSGQQLKRTLETVGHPEWKDELIRIRDRTEMMSKLLEMLDPVLSSASTAHWIEQFARAGIPCARVLGLEEHLEDPQIVHNKTYDTYEHPEHGTVLTARYPAKFRGLRAVVPSPFPPIGGGSSFPSPPGEAVDPPRTEADSV